MTINNKIINDKVKSLKVYPVLLAGGTGTRLWPMSTKSRPKQFVPLFGTSSLFQITVKRFTNIPRSEDLFKFHSPLVVTNSSYSYMVHSQLEELNIKEYDVLEEPAVRDTGPAIALATKHILKKDPNAIILLVPADHYLPDPEEFYDIINKGLSQISDRIVIFGINPTKPETGYGYIERGELIGNDCYEVVNFREKPNKNIAQEYIDNGNYFWNSGIYLFRGKILMDDFREHCPEVYTPIINLDDSYKGFENIPAISIDYAITEKSLKIVMVDSPIKWSDVGSWDGLWEVSDRDDEGNNHIGEVISINSFNNLVRGIKKVITIGLSNIAIVETEDTILIINKDNSQDVKTIAKQIDI